MHCKTIYQFLFSFFFFLSLGLADAVYICQNCSSTNTAILCGRKKTVYIPNHYLQLTVTGRMQHDHSEYDEIGYHAFRLSARHWTSSKLRLNGHQIPSLSSRRLYNVEKCDGEDWHPEQ